jgi:hypothetical protein
MSKWAITTALVTLLGTPLPPLPTAAPNQRVPATTSRWYKGNTHTHTLKSDGDSSPDDVVRWYREHGYNFVVITDHNVLVGVDRLNADLGSAGEFLVIKGEEISDSTPQGKRIHVNGLDIDQLVMPQRGSNVIEVLQRNVDAVRAAGGVPHINHPNFDWAISPSDLAQVANYRLLEIFNAHPAVNNVGDSRRPGVETVWDVLLTSGQVVYGIAVDDAHHFKTPNAPGAAGPGKAWVMVRAEQLSSDAILEALERGEFYASTGVEISELAVKPKRIIVTVNQQPATTYRVQFIGKNGRLLKEGSSNPARYRIRGSEGYVRVKVIASDGKVAWTQPTFVNPSF